MDIVLRLKGYESWDHSLVFRAEDGSHLVVQIPLNLDVLVDRAGVKVYLESGNLFKQLVFGELLDPSFLAKLRVLRERGAAIG